MLIFQENQIEKNFGLAKLGIYYLPVHFGFTNWSTLFKFEIRGRRDSLDRDGRFSLVQHLFSPVSLSYFCSPASSNRSAIERCGSSLVVDFPISMPYLALPFITYFHFSSLSSCGFALFGLSPGPSKC